MVCIADYQLTGILITLDEIFWIDCVSLLF